METYLARADRVIAGAEAVIAGQRRQLGRLRAGRDAAALREAKAALALMLRHLDVLRSNRRLVEEQIKRPMS